MNKYNRFFLLLLLLFAFFTCHECKCLTFPEFNSDKVLIYDYTDDKFLYTKNPEKVTSIASITKILTTITAIENVKDLDKKVQITPQMLNSVNRELSKAGLKSKDKVTYRDLLYASILPSGADATTALAFLISGGVDNFVKLMNSEAKKIGMINSSFVNVTGLDDVNHYSTAEDIYKLVKYSIKNPVFVEIFSAKSYTLTNGLKVKSTYADMLRKSNVDLDKITGGKTGTTGNAGKCFSGTFKSGGHDFIVVFLNAKYVRGKEYALKDVVSITKFMDENYKDQTLIKEGTVVEVLKLKYFKINELEIKTKQTINKYLPNDFDNKKFEAIYNNEKEINIYTKKGDRIGSINYYYDGVKIGDEVVVLEQDLQIDYFKLLSEYKLSILFVCLFIIVVFTFTFCKKRVLKIRKKTIIK